MTCSASTRGGNAWARLVLGAALMCSAPAAAHKHPKHPHHDQAHQAAPASAGIHGHGRQAAAAPRQAEQVEQIEQVEQVESVQPSSGDGGAQAPGGAPTAGAPHLSAQQLVAHFHPALVHLPIAWLLLWVVCELAGGRAVQLRGALPTLSWATVVAFVPATITGLLHIAELPQDPASLQPVMWHRNSMLAAGLACVALATWRQRLASAASPAWARSAYLAALGATLLAVGISAHWGGQLVYGDDYLPF